MGRERNEYLWTVIRPLSVRLDYRIWRGSGQSREKDRIKRKRQIEEAFQRESEGNCMARDS